MNKFAIAALIALLVPTCANSTKFEKGLEPHSNGTVQYLIHSPSTNQQGAPMCPCCQCDYCCCQQFAPDTIHGEVQNK